MGERPDEVLDSNRSTDQETADLAYTDRLSTAGYTGESSSDDEAAQIRADIEHTRSEMSSTIDALQAKLAPEHIAEQVKEQVKQHAAEAFDSAKMAVKQATVRKAEHIMENVTGAVNSVSRKAREFMGGDGSSLLNTVRENPVPLVLIGAGLGMLFANLNSSKKAHARQGPDRESSYGTDNYDRFRDQPWRRSEENRPSTLDRTREAASDFAKRTQDTVSNVTSQARDQVSHLADQARDQVSHFADQARDQVRHLGDTSQTVLRDNPLALGIAVLAAGAIVGLAIPETRVEQEYMGETRDQLFDKAQEVARDTLGKVQHVAQEAGRTIQQEAEHAGLTVGSSPQQSS